jgi:hypothetical protein
VTAFHAFQQEKNEKSGNMNFWILILFLVFDKSVGIPCDADAVEKVSKQCTCLTPTLLDCLVDEDLCQASFAELKTYFPTIQIRGKICPALKTQIGEMSYKVLILRDEACDKTMIGCRYVILVNCNSGAKK